MTRLKDKPVRLIGVRGLTIIEVLASLVLLSMTSSVCIGLLRDAGTQRGMSMREREETRFALRVIADALVSHASALGLPDLSPGGEISVAIPDVGLTWTDVSVVLVEVIDHRERVAWSTLDETDAARDEFPDEENRPQLQRRWLRVSVEGQPGTAVFRWLPAIVESEDREEDATP